jgi:LDH2 family malate/lactate/ureidoglycolate dehydrogenase
MYSLIPVSDLHRFTKQVFLSIGCTKEHAILATDVLIKADLRGIDSHGVARLAGYVRLWENERINNRPEITIVHETPTTATVDGDAGLGLVVAPFAMELAIKKAEQYGSGWVAVKNSNHFGIAAYHAMLAVEKDMIGLAMTNASPLVAPTFSKERMLGTNPICYAFPAGDFPPIIIDMATSAAANGKLEIAQRNNETLPDGWVQDADGNATNNAHGLKEGGSLLPLGTDRTHGSHKGYGLSASVDILSAVLSGANYGPWVPPFVSYLEPLENLPGQGIGHFVGAMRVDGFRPIEDYKKNIDKWITRFKTATPVDNDQKVIIPGEPEYEAEQANAQGGVPVNTKVLGDLEVLAERFNLEKLSS